MVVFGNRLRVPILQEVKVRQCLLTGAAAVNTELTCSRLGLYDEKLLKHYYMSCIRAASIYELARFIVMRRTQVMIFYFTNNMLFAFQSSFRAITKLLLP